MATYLRIATFNVENLIQPGRQYHGKTRTKDEYDAHMAFLVATLARCHADTVALQEVWDEASLKDLAERSHYTHWVFKANTVDSPAVALMSRNPIDDSEYIENIPDAVASVLGDTPTKRFNRPVLRVSQKFGDPARDTTIFVCHLKSKLPKLDVGAPAGDPATGDLLVRAGGAWRSLLERATESLALRHLVIAATAKNNDTALVCGDLNDAAESVTVELIQGERPARDYTSLTRPDGTKYSAEDSAAIKARLRDVMLYDAELEFLRISANAAPFTYIHDGRYTSLDRILYSEELHRLNPKRHGELTNIQVWNDHLLDDTLQGGSRTKGASDHGLVMATFRLDAPTPAPQ